MKEEKITLKIVFLGLLEPISLDVDQRTEVGLRDTQLGQLKKQLWEETLIDVADMKIALNGKVIEEGHQTKLQDLGVTNNTTLALLTKHTKIRRDYVREREEALYARLKGDNLRDHDFHRLFLRGDGEDEEKRNSMKKLNGFVTLEHLNRLVEYLFPEECWRGREEQLLKQEGLIIYILSKIVDGVKEHPNHPYVQKIFKLLEGRVVKTIIFQGQNIQENDQHPPLTYDPLLFQKLVKMKFSEQRIIDALHRTCNGYQRTLEMLLSEGGSGSDSFTVQCGEHEEERFIYRWLTEPKHRGLAVRMALDPKEIEIYLNSLKLRCKTLYDIFRRHRIFITKVLCRETSNIFPLKEEKILISI